MNSSQLRTYALDCWPQGLSFPSGKLSHRKMLWLMSTSTKLDLKSSRKTPLGVSDQVEPVRDISIQIMTGNTWGLCVAEGRAGFEQVT